MVRSKQTSIPVSEALYDRLREQARRNGEQIGTTLDAIIRRYLDEKVGKA